MDAQESLGKPSCQVRRQEHTQPRERDAHKHGEDQWDAVARARAPRTSQTNRTADIGSNTTLSATEHLGVPSRHGPACCASGTLAAKIQSCC